MTRSEAGVLAIIPARGGSQGLPRKNVLPMAGRPLIAWSIAAARAARCVQRVIVSTDDEEIAAVARTEGAEVPFLRPARLATATAPSDAVVRHALEQSPGWPFVLLLQPTSPLRTAQDIDAAFAQMQRSGRTSCVSICAVEESPWLMVSRGSDGCIAPLLPPSPHGDRRQDLPAAYRINGAIYLAESAWFLRTGRLIGPETLGYEMPGERSIDIDTRRDFERAERVLQEGHR